MHLDAPEEVLGTLPGMGEPEEIVRQGRQRGQRCPREANGAQIGGDRRRANGR